MESRGAVRSSARLCTAGAAAAPGEHRARPVEAAAAAALRRARAAERAREVEDSPRVLREKCRRLARALRNAKHLVVYTGAGISTAADIPDYRGPRGVWTRLQRGETVGRVEVSRATPTFTHMALTALWARGALKFVVSQNCDGLHLRSGLPRRALAELHGDMFAEHCIACRRVYLRTFDTTERTARHAHGTRRLCHGCGLELRDTIVHFGERGRAAWPLNWAGALRHAAAADVILCLGSSLKVLRRYPRLWCMQRAPQARPALYIVNLQWTPKDSVAALKINARCDAVMAEVTRRLRLRVPRYKPRRDPLLAHAVPLAPPEAHTTRRPLLSAPNSESDDVDPSSSDPASPSASESDDELPLKRLADRLRGPPPPPDLLRAFQVTMKSGTATILLRTEHAPIQPPPEPPPSDGASQRKPISDLRRFRMPQRPREPNSICKSTINGCNQFARTSIESVDPSVVPMGVLKKEPKEELDCTNGAWGVDSKLRQLLEYEPCIEPKVESKDSVLKSECVDPKEEETSSSSDESLCRSRARSLAAAIIRRAMLVCRASLYSGLHTIISPPSPVTSPLRVRSPLSRAQCSWCTRHFAARRCLWYRPAGRALGARVWRRVRGRRYLCACCGDEAEAAAGGDGVADVEAPEPVDDGGWYGKGYRKGRRKRR